MRLVILTTGSWGDLQPFVAVAAGLQSRGHEVCIATHEDYAPFVRSWGICFWPIDADSRIVHGGPAGRRLFEHGDDPWVFIHELGRIRAARMQSTMAACYEASRQADAILISFTTLCPGLSVAEKLGIPSCVLALQPTTPTRFLASCLLPSGPDWYLPVQAYHWLSHFLVGECLWQQVRQAVNQARRDVLGLPPFSFLGPPPRILREQLTLYGYSPAVVPPPTDWGPRQRVTGYWWLPAHPTWSPPSELAEFLHAGPPPLCIGFGSIMDRHAAERTKCTIEALTRLKQRAVLLTGWGGLEPIPPSDQFYVTDRVPHEWIFPRVAGIVHHGGAGTTAAAIRAGVPALVVPFMAEQPFWAGRVAALGLGPPPIPHKELSADRLVAGLRTLLERRSLRTRAAALAEQVRAEDGVGSAIEIIEAWLADPAPVTRNSTTRTFLPSPFATPSPLAPAGLARIALRGVPGWEVLRIPSLAAVPPEWRSGRPWGPEANAARAAGRLPNPRPSRPLRAWDDFGQKVLTTGDLVFRLGRSLGPWDLFMSRFVARIQDSDFTHTGLVFREGNNVWIYDCEREGVRKIPFAIWMLDTEPQHFAVRRLRPEYRDRLPKILAYCEEKYHSCVGFDGALSQADDRMYCTKFIELACRAAGLPLSEPLPVCRLPNYERLRAFAGPAERYLNIRMDVPVYLIGNEHYGVWASPYLEPEPVYLSPALREQQRPHKPPVGIEPRPAPAVALREREREKAAASDGHVPGRFVPGIEPALG